MVRRVDGCLAKRALATRALTTSSKQGCTLGSAKWRSRRRCSSLLDSRFVSIPDLEARCLARKSSASHAPSSCESSALGPASLSQTGKSSLPSCLSLKAPSVRKDSSLSRIAKLSALGFSGFLSQAASAGKKSSKSLGKQWTWFTYLVLAARVKDSRPFFHRSGSDCRNTSFQPGPASSCASGHVLLDAAADRSSTTTGLIL